MRSSAILGRILVAIVTMSLIIPSAFPQTATQQMAPGQNLGVIAGAIERFALQHPNMSAGIAGAGSAEALTAAGKATIKGVIITAGFMEAIRLYGFGKLMEYCIETALDARNSAEYTQQVTNIQTGLSEHRFIGSTIVGNEIAANIRRHPDQTAKLCRMMSDVGITPAPQVAQQIGCTGAVASIENKEGKRNLSLPSAQATAASPDPQDDKNRNRNTARKYGLNADSPTTQQLMDKLDTPLTDFISKYRLASISRVIPTQYLDGETTVREAMDAGGSTVRKMLVDNRFVK